MFAELQNTIKRALLLASTPRVEVQDLQLPKVTSVQRRPQFEPDEMQLRRALCASASIAEAARNLGLSRQSLYRRLQKFGIDTRGNIYPE